MSLKEVYLTGDVFLNCLQLAFSNEKQEVMGLLIGELKPTDTDDKSVNALITHLFIPQRADRKRDRVETSPEQLIEASVEAEALSKKLQKPVTVCGWFHSHPHITVFPSHVDVKTQAAYQMMEKGFVGIICSIFNTDQHHKNRVKLTCFQSNYNNLKGDYESVDIPFHILPVPSISSHSFETMINMQKTLNLEEINDFSLCMAQLDNKDFLTRFQNHTALAHAFSRIAEVFSQPLFAALSLRLEHNQNTIARLKEQIEMAEKQNKKSLKRSK
nr:PREDICTED: lys-63-specific deubiquitinase BRCC36-like [Bemisia tabaci]